MLTGCGRGPSAQQYQPRTPGTVTFNKEIAPILFQHCGYCHRPGQAAPFSLLTYEEARKRARQIAEVTQKRFMPPWLPEPGHVAFADERQLSAEQIGLIQQWAEEGASEGKPSDLPAAPQWAEGWQLGKPDLVIEMAEPYALAAEGRDVYRNFALPIPVTAMRYVEAVEFRPGNFKVVHHAAMRVDRTTSSRRLDDQEAGAGFAGMQMPETTEMPDGQFLNWQPGKLPYRVPEGLAWTLHPGTDLVVQLHLHPSGKPESVRCSVGFHFTDKPPTQRAFKLILDAPYLDIAAGRKDYVVTDSYTLPVDVDALAVFPHAHYLATEMQAYARRPDGSKQWLLFIRQWDFNWQGDYRYAKPIFLPKGTTLEMRFTYDNSAENPRNPHQPPRRVQFGWETTDEMGELWLQVAPRDPRQLETLTQDYVLREINKTISLNETRLRADPNNVKALNQLGRALVILGRGGEALPHFQQAARLQPESDEPHYYLGLIHRMENRPAEAIAEFEHALRTNPGHFKAHGNLGFIYLAQGNAAAAEHHFQRALELNPADALARTGLEQAERAAGKR
jgi:tetratricopeptide (TPR) repeat protein